MSPEDMLKASREAQEQMAKMTPEEREQVLKNMS
jgi:acyl-CoA reductase-like NAD-dependent aldehyde dehydrogenase